jgi:hypothetical protein
MSCTPETIGVAMLGYAFMGKAHSHAFREADFLEPAALREAQREKDAVRAYELVYAALGAE